jgi:hypothetical protein
VGEGELSAAVCARLVEYAKAPRQVPARDHEGEKRRAIRRSPPPAASPRTRPVSKEGRLLSLVMKAIRGVLLALLFSLLVGFLIGLVLRSRLERPREYIGSVAPARPLDVGHARAPVLDARQHEEQIREAVEQA